MPIIKVADLDQRDLARLNDLENELGNCVVGYKQQSTPGFARLSEDQLNRLQSTEQELGIILLAYDCE